MDVLFFFLGIVAICAAISGCALYALWTHHERELERLRVRQHEVNQMFLLSEKMVERGMLPPAAREFR